MCQIGASVAAGTDREKVGLSDGGGNFRSLACDEGAQIVGIALDMSDRPINGNSHSARGIQIGCATVTIDASKGQLGPHTMKTSEGNGGSGWTPSTMTPLGLRPHRSAHRHDRGGHRRLAERCGEPVRSSVQSGRTSGLDGDRYRCRPRLAPAALRADHLQLRTGILETSQPTTMRPSAASGSRPLRRSVADADADAWRTLRPDPEPMQRLLLGVRGCYAANHAWSTRA